MPTGWHRFPARPNTGREARAAPWRYRPCVVHCAPCVDVFQYSLDDGAGFPLWAGIAAPGAPGFGALVAIDQSRAWIESEKPTLYATTVTTTIGGADHEQAVYVWRYPAPDGGERCISREGRGLRITLAQDGFPLVWEALSSDTRTMVLFIAESLEQAARREFGDPLPGGRFSIERAADETPDVVVARIIDDGPVPMGPYVYLNAPPSRAVTTVLCRCSPSQVEAFLETRYYDFRSKPSTRATGD